MRLRSLSALCALCVAGGLIATAQNTVPPSHVLQVGEELTYNVRYGPFDLGQVRIRTLARATAGGYLTYETKALIDSYPKVPFVDLHATFESSVDTTIYSHHFVGKVKQDNAWSFARYSFDYGQLKRLVIERGMKDSVIMQRDTVAINQVYQDGLSLFFFARDRLFSGASVTVPAIVTEQKVNARINFHGKHDVVDLETIGYPVDVVGFEGTADFVGIFGLTGDFEGWFSNDEARVPIMAKMKVLIGSVSVELMQWKRAGWTPPRGKD
jgi:hypothetical protein